MNRSWRGFDRRKNNLESITNEKCEDQCGLNHCVVTQKPIKLTRAFLFDKEKSFSIHFVFTFSSSLNKMELAALLKGLPCVTSNLDPPETCVRVLKHVTGNGKRNVRRFHPFFVLYTSKREKILRLCVSQLFYRDTWQVPLWILDSRTFRVLFVCDDVLSAQWR